MNSENKVVRTFNSTYKSAKNNLLKFKIFVWQLPTHIDIF